MILNCKKFSDIAFSKHIASADCCSVCRKKVLHPLKQEHNYNDFVFGMNYDDLIKSFYSEIDYITSLFYEGNTVKNTSFSYIHNKHNDTFLIVYFVPITSNKIQIEKFNANFLTTLEKYTTQQRKSLIYELTYFYLRTQKDINVVNSNIEKTITCIDHTSHNTKKRKQLPENHYIKKSMIDLANIENILEPNIRHLMQSASMLQGRPSLLQHKKRITAFLFDAYYKWIEANLHKFPNVVCNSCAGKKVVTAKLKEKFNILDDIKDHNPSEFLSETK